MKNLKKEAPRKALIKNVREQNLKQGANNMKYLNFILTIIAVLLLAIVFKLSVSPARAGTGIQDVNINSIAGRSLFNRVLDVNVIK